MHMNKKRKQEFELTESMTLDFKKLIKENNIHHFRVQSAKQMLLKELSKSDKLKEIDLICIPETKEIENTQKPEIKEAQLENKQIEELKEEIKNLKEEIKKKEVKNQRNETVKLKQIEEVIITEEFKTECLQNLKDRKKEGFIPYKTNNEKIKERENKIKPTLNELLCFPLSKSIQNYTNDKESFNIYNLKFLETELNESKKKLYSKTEKEIKNCINDISEMSKEIKDLKEIIIFNFLPLLNLNPQFQSSDQFQSSAQFQSSELKEHKNDLQFVFEKLNKEKMFLKDLVNPETQSLNLKPILKNKDFFNRLIEKELKENQKYYELKENLFQIFKYIKGDTKEHAIHIKNLQEELETKKIYHETCFFNLKNKQNIVLNFLKNLTNQTNIFSTKIAVNLELKKIYEQKEIEALKILEENQKALNERTVFYKNSVSFQMNSVNFLKDFKRLNFLKYNLKNVIKEVEEYRIKLTCLCDKNIKNAVIENCMHTFCKGCLENRLKRRERSCPICQKCYANFVIKEFYF